MRQGGNCPGPIRLTRRQIVQVGGISLLGLSLETILRADDERRAKNGPRPKADACILVFLNGGPSHLDTFDMKPDAPEAIRGEFRPIPSSLVGLQVCEHLPRLSRLMHLGTVIRSAHHSVNNSHAAAVYCALTGHDRGEQGGGAKPDDNPAIGSVVAKIRPPDRTTVPYVCMPYKTQEGAGGPPQPGFFAGWLGRSYDPLFILQDPGAPDFRVAGLSPRPELGPDRLTRRHRLLSRIDASLAGPLPRPLREMGQLQEKAFELLTSPVVQRAFRVQEEPESVRERYGKNIYGHSVLLARRLIEAGTRVACISWAPHANATWDTHGNNFKTLRQTLLPQLDAAVASLLEDLRDRGLLERTIVAVMGEFGRTPKVNKNAGRDHWNYCYSLALFGGGFRQGYIHGASDRNGAFPAADPVTPGEIVATIYHCLGVSPDLTLPDALGRPLRIVPEGRILHELLA